MSEEKRQKVILEEGRVEENNIVTLIEDLEELERKNKRVDIQICPKCKSNRVRKVGSMGDMLGHTGSYHPIFECLDCGWRGRLVIKATNRNLGVKEVAIISDAANPEKHR
jgi:hypothetical protein